MMCLHEAYSAYEQYWYSIGVNVNWISSRVTLNKRQSQNAYLENWAFAVKVVGFKFGYISPS